MSRIVKLLLVLVVVAVLWRVFSGGPSEVDIDYEPTS
jgi:hypothetical protein